jgi:hypothetical protein
LAPLSLLANRNIYGKVQQQQPKHPELRHRFFGTFRKWCFCLSPTTTVEWSSEKRCSVQHHRNGPKSGACSPPVTTAFRMVLRKRCSVRHSPPPLNGPSAVLSVTSPPPLFEWSFREAVPVHCHLTVERKVLPVLVLCLLLATHCWLRKAVLCSSLRHHRWNGPPKSGALSVTTTVFSEWSFREAVLCHRHTAFGMVPSKKAVLCPSPPHAGMVLRKKRRCSVRHPPPPLFGTVPSEVVRWVGCANRQSICPSAVARKIRHHPGIASAASKSMLSKKSRENLTTSGTLRRPWLCHPPEVRIKVHVPEHS